MPPAERLVFLPGAALPRCEKSALRELQKGSRFSQREHRSAEKERTSRIKARDYKGKKPSEATDKCLEMEDSS